MHAAAGRRLDLADGMDGASTWNTGFCGSPSPNSCRGRGTNVDVSGPWPAAVQRRHATTRACFFGGQSLPVPAHSSPRRAGRECAGIAKTTPLRLSLTPGRPPNLGHQSLFLVWPTQTEFTRHRLRLEMDAACCSGHRRTERRKNGEKKVRWLCTGTGTWPVNCGCDALDATADGSISLSSFLSSLVRQNTPNLGPSHRAFEVGLPRSAVRRGQGVPWVAH